MTAKAKIIAALLAFCTIGFPASALEIGPVSDIGWYGLFKGWTVKGYTSIDAVPYSDSRQRTFSQGTAIFGNQEAPLYVHFDHVGGNTRSEVGGADTNSLSEVYGYEVQVKRALTDAGDTLYFVLGGDSNYKGQIVCFGYRAGSSQILKYFDTEDARRAFGIPLNFLGKWRIEGSTVVIPYKETPLQKTDDGVLYYRWDEAAQWFSVENVSY